MTSLAVGLLAVVVAEYTRAWGPPGRAAVLRLPGAAAIVLLLGLGLGLPAGEVAAVVAVAVLWDLVRDRHPWEVAGLVLVAMALGGLALVGDASAPTGLERWWSEVELPALRAVSLEQALLAGAVVLFQLRPANAVVRTVLDHAGEGVLGEERTLRGGRLLGPLERVLIFAMALGGVYGVLAVVVAAKGILRFPEISRDEPDGTRAEYVLVGSFVSWSLALAFVPLF